MSFCLSGAQPVLCSLRPSILSSLLIFPGSRAVLLWILPARPTAQRPNTANSTLPHLSIIPSCYSLFLTLSRAAPWKSHLPGSLRNVLRWTCHTDPECIRGSGSHGLTQHNQQRSPFSAGFSQDCAIQAAGQWSSLSPLLQPHFPIPILALLIHSCFFELQSHLLVPHRDLQEEGLKAYNQFQAVRHSGWSSLSGGRDLLSSWQIRKWKLVSALKVGTAFC